jgi:hypothetical protein
MYCSFRKAELFGQGYCSHGWQDATVKDIQVERHLQLRIMSDIERLYFLEFETGRSRLQRLLAGMYSRSVGQTDIRKLWFKRCLLVG